MATPGLSLVGFMQDPQHVINHLRNTCVPDPIKTDQALLADWAAAQGTLGPAFANAGKPGMQAIPTTDPHIQQLMQGPLNQSINSLLAQGATFQMIEIDALLAFQFTVCKSRSNTHCGSLSSPPSKDELMNCCLPIAPQNDVTHISCQPQSVIIKSRSLNLHLAGAGINAAGGNFVGIQFAWALPLVHVVRYNGRCYLHNGYHRAFGVKMAGANEIPCMFRDVSDAETTGIKPEEATFQEALLTSANPPTMAHFSQGRAHDVDLRNTSRILQVSWSDHVMPEE